MTVRLTGDDSVQNAVVEILRDHIGGIKPAVLYEKLRVKWWDIDDNDVRHALSWLFANGIIRYTFAGKLALIET